MLLFSFFKHRREKPCVKLSMRVFVISKDQLKALDCNFFQIEIEIEIAILEKTWGLLDNTQ
jgi:hypothetical protein